MSLAVVSNWLKDFDIGHATTTGIDEIKPANLGVEVFFNWGSTYQKELSPKRIFALSDFWKLERRYSPHTLG